MRDILFRGKDIETGKWHLGQYIHLHKTSYCFEGEGNNDNNIHQIVFERMTDWGLPNEYFRADVDPETVGEYTGIKDTTGKWIFEGDIVVNDLSQFERLSTKPHVVKFTNGKWEYISDAGRKVKIIGNIHDNPELLNK